MRFRVYFSNNEYFPTYFKTKREAVEFQTRLGGEVQRKIGCDWYNC